MGVDFIIDIFHSFFKLNIKPTIQILFIYYVLFLVFIFLCNILLVSDVVFCFFIKVSDSCQYFEIIFILVLVY